MTIEDYNKARDLVIKIDALEGEIRDLRMIMDKDVSSWIMEVRPSTTCSPMKIKHFGLLPEFLQAVLSKHLAKLHELKKELDEL